MKSNQDEALSLAQLATSPTMHPEAAPIIMAEAQVRATLAVADAITELRWDLQTMWNVGQR